MRFLLDTNVLRELWHERGSPRVRAAIAAIDQNDLFLSVITLGEAARGIAELPAGAKRSRLTRYLTELEKDYESRVLPVTAAIAHRWGELTAASRGKGKALPAADGLIAATALVHGLAVMTRNGKDFAAAGVEVIDPGAE